MLLGIILFKLILYINILDYYEEFEHQLEYFRKLGFIIFPIFQMKTKSIIVFNMFNKMFLIINYIIRKT